MEEKNKEKIFRILFSVPLIAISIVTFFTGALFIIFGIHEIIRRKKIDGIFYISLLISLFSFYLFKIAKNIDTKNCNATDTWY